MTAAARAAAGGGRPNPTEGDTSDTSYICVSHENPRISAALRGESDKIAVQENKNVLTNVGNYLARLLRADPAFKKGDDLGGGQRHRAV
jgi:hypothetical protein